MTTVDLDAYFDRIRWGGPARPTLETLTSLLAAHMAAIPWENLDVLLGRRVRLDLEGLQQKLVAGRRGGYCFEHATLLAAVLERLGFRPARHSARVTLFFPRTESPRGHMFLTVPLDEGTFVVDPGFGGLAPRLPVPVREGTEARIGAECHAMVRDGACWIQRVHTGGKVLDGWVSTLEVDNPIDFEVANHYTATHPGSPFVNRMMLRALTPDGRVSVMNREVTTVSSGESRASQLADRSELGSLLRAYFGFDLPEVNELRVPSLPEWA